MASPQREDGHIDIANDIAEQLAKVNLSPYESRLMWAVLRKTWGYVQRDKNGKIIKDSRGWPLKKKLDWVSVSQLQELTNLDRRNVSRMKLRLLRRKVLIKNGNKLGFNRDYDQWLSLKQTTDNVVYRDTRPKWFPPPGYAYKHSDGRLCDYCLKEFRFNKDELESHHIIPISMGGKDIKENQIWLCIPCHKKIEKEFRELNIVDLDDIPKIQRYYRQFVSLVSSKQTTFLSSKQTNTKEKRNITKESKPIYVELPKNTTRLFSFWKEHLNHPKAILTKDRKTKIGARLKEGYTIEQGEKAIMGCKSSSYHMGDNKQGRVYDSIELIFRNGDKIEQFINIYEEVQKHGKGKRSSQTGSRKGWQESDKYRGLYSRPGGATGEAAGPDKGEHH